MSSEVKVQLLSEEFAKLQLKVKKLERENETLKAVNNNEETFASRILAFVASLKAKSDYSDFKLTLKTDEEIPAHKFIFAARSPKVFGSINGTLDWSHLDKEIADILLTFIYTR